MIKLKTRHYNIPIFIPELACPHQCVFCDQRKISGQDSQPTPQEVSKIIDSYLQTMKSDYKEVEVAFFGGSFTGIDKELQIEYLKVVQPYIRSGEVNGIRVSTRPDYIDKQILETLKRFGVKSIELGAQSLDAEVLKKSGRGHSVSDVESAANMIKAEGFELGLQMMIGLPEDSKEKTIFTAKRIVELGADTTRIYPTLVIQGTALERLFVKGRYEPLTISQAVCWTKEVVRIFQSAGVKILRVGLHPSEEISEKGSLVCGPYHQSFREMVDTAIWEGIFKNDSNIIKGGRELLLFVSRSQLNYAVGYKGANKIMLSRKFSKVKFVGCSEINGLDYKAELIDF
ncbi:elongator complex protein 3 [Aureibacter tunicatorum]|uniref:Histone acetyltransferase (RNA polymerase elongator complex component) n=1 Tax=Aureibacter tunicatorum TaxID=866807 RepID=A0AAE3XL06_9BACT|nr:radical SAM protein [Aureibacter tunicatorum]MDR6237938.1 histone acetyltransferase (RNA polymerase elongator complex component) [Aureibacter tunicatorum]BDD02971.1 coproporphyrinogen III oxidase [Aureibacter tunicatorum]